MATALIIVASVVTIYVLGILIALRGPARRQQYALAALRTPDEIAAEIDRRGLRPGIEYRIKLDSIDRKIRTLHIEQDDLFYGTDTGTKADQEESVRQIAKLHEERSRVESEWSERKQLEQERTKLGQIPRQFQHERKEHLAKAALWPVEVLFRTSDGATNLIWTTMGTGAAKKAGSDRATLEDLRAQRDALRSLVEESEPESETWKVLGTAVSEASDKVRRMEDTMRERSGGVAMNRMSPYEVAPTRRGWPHMS